MHVKAAHKSIPFEVGEDDKSEIVTVRLQSLSFSHLRSGLVKFTTSPLIVCSPFLPVSWSTSRECQCYFRFNYAAIYVQHLRIWIQKLFGPIIQKNEWWFTFDHLCDFDSFCFLIARWRWLPDCRTVFEEGVWQPRDLRLEVLGGWEVYPRSQGSAENQVHCTTLDWSFCGIEDWERADNRDALWRHKHKIEIKNIPGNNLHIHIVMFFWPLRCLAFSRCLCLSCKRHVEVKIGLLFPAFPFITALEHSVSAFQSHAPLHCLSLGRSQAVCSASLRAHSTHNVPHFGGIRCKWHLWDAVRGQTVCLFAQPSA